MYKTVCTCIVLGLLAMTISNAQDGREILKKADAKLRGSTAITEMSIKIVRPSWTREMTMKSSGK